MAKTREQALKDLYNKAGYTGPKKEAPAKKPSMADNYKTLGKKMVQSGSKAMGRGK